MPRRTSAELVQEARSAMDASASLLVEGDTAGAVSQALIAWKAARAQRSLRLLSDAWMFFVDTMAADAVTLDSPTYRGYVDGAFYWAETMPEEIQAWFCPPSFLICNASVSRVSSNGLVRVRRRQKLRWHEA